MIAAIVAWVDGAGDEERPRMPPELGAWLKIKRWGDPFGGGWLDWPAGYMNRVQAARNVYETYMAYVRAENRGSWLNEHPEAGGVLGIIKELKFGSEDDPGRVATWERWVGALRQEIDG